MYTLRFCKAPDFNFFQQLHESGYRDRVTELYGSWDDALQADFQKNEFYAPHQGRFIIVQDNKDIGYLSYSFGDSLLFLQNILIAEKHRKSGLGKTILLDLQDLAKSLKVGMKLRTFINNPARGLYERLGFKEVGIEGKPFVMEWHG